MYTASQLMAVIYCDGLGVASVQLARDQPHHNHFVISIPFRRTALWQAVSLSNWLGAVGLGPASQLGLMFFSF